MDAAPNHGRRAGGRPPVLVGTVAEAREADAREHAVLIAAARAAYGGGGRLPGTRAGAEAGAGAPHSASEAASDADALAQAYRFLPTQTDAEAAAAEEAGPDRAAAWRARLARAYYARLFREYAVADLTRAAAAAGGLVGLRWRTQAEVVAGRGHLLCGARPACAVRSGLATFELPFEYEEGGEVRRALVKVRLCPAHGAALGEARRAAVGRAAEAERRAAGGGASRGKRQR